MSLWAGNIPVSKPHYLYNMAQFSMALIKLSFHRRNPQFAVIYHKQTNFEPSDMFSFEYQMLYSFGAGAKHRHPSVKLFYSLFELFSKSK